MRTRMLAGGFDSLRLNHGQRMPHSILFLAMLIGSPALAAAPLSPASGARLADSCTSCHGLGGRGGEAIPTLAGQKQEALKTRMQELASASGDSTIMGRILRAFSQDEIEALSRYFSEVNP